MHQRRIIIQESEERHGEPDAIYEILYYCPPCMAERWGCSILEAQAHIINNQPHTQRRRAFQEKFRIHDEQVAAEIPALSKGERRNITIKMMTDAVTPISRFILLKAAALRHRGTVLDEHAELTKRMSLCKTMAEVEMLLPEVEALEEKIEELSKPLAFASKGEMPQEFCLVADYSDEWTIIRNPDGSIKSAIRSYHLCTSGGAEWECCTVIESKAWLRRFGLVAWCPKQRWWCNCCGARYAPKMGMLVEIHGGGNVFWLYSEYPWEWRDVKWMSVEEKHRDALTPKSLFDMIETVSPYLGDGMLRRVEPHELKPGSSGEGGSLQGGEPSRPDG
ncbi:hypothetical protein [Limnohabitans sp.]|uniref:hypothetical protein n=1 Tax=Limnohabitans sp. TaxID=1907725 RepID=UPI00333FAA46